MPRNNSGGYKGWCRGSDSQGARLHQNPVMQPKTLPTPRATTQGTNPSLLRHRDSGNQFCFNNRFFSLLALKIHTSFRNQGANKESESPRLGVRSTGKERNGSSRTHGQHGHVSTAAYSQVDTSELCALATLNNHSDCRMTGSPPIQLELVSPCLCLLRACG